MSERLNSGTGTIPERPFGSVKWFKVNRLPEMMAALTRFDWRPAAAKLGIGGSRASEIRMGAKAVSRAREALCPYEPFALFLIKHGRNLSNFRACSAYVP